VRRGKSQPWVRENFYPLTNSEFQTPICKPWEVKFPIFDCPKKNPSVYPDIWGGQSQPKSESFLKNPFTNSDIWGPICKPWSEIFCLLEDVFLYIRTYRGVKPNPLKCEILRWCLWSSPSGCPNHCLNYIKYRLKTPEQIWSNFAIFVSNLTQLQKMRLERHPIAELFKLIYNN
jgi:hypothetical protein